MADMPKCEKMDDTCVLDAFHPGQCSSYPMCDRCLMTEHRKCSGMTCECICAYAHTRRRDYTL